LADVPLSCADVALGKAACIAYFAVSLNTGQTEDGAARMAYWLVKSEPGAWSWDDQVKAKVAEWDGIRNYQADNNMKAMKKGDKAFFYHSIDEKQIVGLLEVVKEHYPDNTDASGRFGMVDFKAIKAMTEPVTLAQVKAEPALQEMALVRQTRLSVMPVTAAEWKTILKMGKTKP
jgi:predicted RNA-binding protein with PUA-like domain